MGYSQQNPAKAWICRQRRRTADGKGALLPLKPQNGHTWPSRQGSAPLTRDKLEAVQRSWTGGIRRREGVIYKEKIKGPARPGQAAG